MIYDVRGIRFEVKWRRQLDGEKTYYWRFADEIDSLWNGPFASTCGAILNIEQIQSGIPEAS